MTGARRSEGFDEFTPRQSTALPMNACASILATVAATLLIGLTGPIGCRTSEEARPVPVREPAAGRREPLPLPRQVKAIWVARYHYRTADDIAQIMANCAALGFNTVFWQVRGEGTVSYPSQLEPWGREYDYRDPGFDPLALAVDEAHRRGLRLEAWFNVVPGWRGPTPPPIAAQLYNAHPDWFLYDADGRRQPLGDFYVLLNPCRPEVRRHIVRLVEEIVSRYDVDGVHLDYVRYAWDGLSNAKQNYPRDPQTVAAFYRDTGKHPDDDPAAWNHWRANQLTRIVVEIRQTLRRCRPGATLTAAVWRNPVLGYNDFLQNSVVWLRSGIVDALVPMAYTEKLNQFQSDINEYRRLTRGRRVIPGLGAYLHKNEEQLRRQLHLCRTWGGDYALFSYDSLFAPPTEVRTKNTPETERLRELRRSVLTESAAY